MFDCLASFTIFSKIIDQCEVAMHKAAKPINSTAYILQNRPELLRLVVIRDRFKHINNLQCSFTAIRSLPARIPRYCPCETEISFHLNKYLVSLRLFNAQNFPTRKLNIRRDTSSVYSCLLFIST